MTKYYYAFNYKCGLDTTTGNHDTYKIAGNVLVFDNKKARDEACDNRQIGGTHAVTKKYLSQIGHGKSVIHRDYNSMSTSYCECFLCHGHDVDKFPVRI